MLEGYQLQLQPHTASKVWGKGTAFDTFRDFQKAIESNGSRLSFVRLSLSERHSSLKTVEVFCRAEIMTKVSQPWKCLQWTWRLLKAGQNGQNMLAASCNMFARTWRVFSRCSMSSMDRRLVQCPAVHSPMSGSQNSTVLLRPWIVLICFVTGWNGVRFAAEWDDRGLPCRFFIFLVCCQSICCLVLPFPLLSLS